MKWSGVSSVCLSRDCEKVHTLKNQRSVCCTWLMSRGSFFSSWCREVMRGKPGVASMAIVVGHYSWKTQHGLRIQPAAMLPSVWRLTQTCFLNVVCCDRYFNDRLSIFTEFLPQTVFLLSMFGYLILLIVYKWIAYDASMSSCAPSLLIGELSVPTVKNLKFLKSKMTASAILKNWKITISRLRFKRFRQNLAWLRSSTLLTVLAVKNFIFWKSKMSAAAILKNRDI